TQKPRAPGGCADARPRCTLASEAQSICGSHGTLAVKVVEPYSFGRGSLHSNSRGASVIGLLNPRSARWKHRIPLSILSLAAVLEGRHPYQLIDGNIDRDVRGILSRAIQSGNVRYLGV